MKLLLATVAAALGLLLIAGWFGELHPALDSIGHFRLHLAASAVLAIVVLGDMRMRGIAAALAVVVVGTGFLTWPALPGLTPVAGQPQFVVAQQNLLFLNDQPESAAAVLMDTRADVLLLQELAEDHAAILRLTERRYPHRSVCRFRKFRGVAILSRHPFASEPSCEEESGLVTARVRLDQGEVTFASLHTYWPWLYPQWKAIRDIEERLRSLAHPLVLAGDFNAAPWSALVARAAALSGTRPVPGLRFTFNLRTLQDGDSRFGGLPLDHTLHSSDLRPVFAHLIPDLGSDHLGTRVGFAFAQP